MYVSYTRVDTSASPVDDASVVAEEMLRWLRDIDGFEGFLMLSREGTSIGLTFWESRAVAERHRVARQQFLERMTSVAGVQIEERTDFEVAFSELGPRLTAFSGNPSLEREPVDVDVVRAEPVAEAHVRDTH